MKRQTMLLGETIARYRSGDTWFDRSLELIWNESGKSVTIEGTQAIIALRDFLNSLDFSGRRLTLVIDGAPAASTAADPREPEARGARSEP